VALNPFTWQDPITDPARIVGRTEFAELVALRLKAGTNVALFGVRGTGKTTFTVQLDRELRRRHGDDAPPSEVIYINLQWALSLPALIAAVTAGMRRSATLSSKARHAIGSLEKEFGINLGVVQGSLKSGAVRTDAEDEQLLYKQLVSLRELADPLVVIFDEFQRLRACRGRPLAVVRDALGGVDAGHVSMLLTGSIREALRMLLEQSDEPLFQQAAPMDLPEIEFADWFDYLSLSFSSTGKQAADSAIEHLLRLTRGHPRRTQQVAWSVWEATSTDERVGLEAIEPALASSVAMSGVGDELARLIEEDDTLARLLSILSEQDGLTSISGEQLHRYGLSHWSTASRGLERLRARGFAEQRDNVWTVSDPFFSEWLRRNSPFRQA